MKHKRKAVFYRRPVSQDEIVVNQAGTRGDLQHDPRPIASCIVITGIVQVLHAVLPVFHAVLQRYALTALRDDDVARYPQVPP